MEPTVLAGSEAPHPLTEADAANCTDQSRLISVLDELLALAPALLAAGATENLAAARARVADDRFNLVVLGEFKRGKSTLINAVLGRDIVPTGVLPQTSVVTAIAGAKRDRLIVRHRDQRNVERPIEELANFVTEAGNPHNRLGVDFARVELDHELLRTGLELVDTPGVGSIYEHNSETARAFLPQVDAGILVLDAGQPLSESERALLCEARVRVPRLLIVVNKIDHIDEAERQLAVDFVRSAIRPLLGGAEPALFPVSARLRQGLEPLTAYIKELATRQRVALVAQSVAALARGAAADVAQGARFEARAITLPLDDLTDRRERFEQRIAELRSAHDDATDLLDRGLGRIVRQWINEPLTNYAEQNQARLHTALHGHVESLGKLSPRELAIELEQWIDAAVRAEFEHLLREFEAGIADQLTNIENRYSARIQRLVEQVQEAAEQVFGERAADVVPATGLRAESRFSFKLDDVEHALDIIVGFGRTITPGSFGRRLVIRNAEQRLIQMVDRHAGRLRSELAGRATDSVREFQRALGDVVVEAVAIVRRAIDRATSDRRRGEQFARARLDRLGAIELRSQQLAIELDRWLDSIAAETGMERLS